MNQDVINHILECTDTCKEVSHELYSLLNRGSIRDFNKVSSEFVIFLKKIQQTSDTYYDRDGTVKLGNAVESVLYSLRNIIDYSKINIPLALNKIEFELIPFVETMYAEYYFWATVYPNREKWEDYYENELPELYSNKYIDKSIIDGKYKYDLSIIVVGYNKLEYTKLCVESVIANLPEDVSCELILLNHGSTDGTKEYFEAIKPTKQMDIKINGSLNSVVCRIIEGEFFISISNDTIITSNAIGNMYKTLRDDSNIGWVVPSTPNVSNLQTIPAEYNNFDEMIEWTKKNNIYDIFRHETRTRLCNPICMARSKYFYCQEGININGRYYNSFDYQTFSFPDDEMSMLLRRSGLKSVLCKDAYCYHFGSVTITEISEKQKIDTDTAYRNGRIEFMKTFGIDPWGTGFCYDYNLFASFECKFECHTEVLGINCGMGSNSLKIKEMYKEVKHNLDVYLTNTVNEEIMVNEINAVSNEVHLIKQIECIKDINDKKYNYIVFEDAFDETGHNLPDIEFLADYLIDDGELYVNTNNDFDSKKYKAVERVAGWLRFTK